MGAIGASSAMVEDDRRHALAMIPVSRETEATLDRIVAELRRWQNVHNLVGARTLEHVWTRHIADSAQLFALACAQAGRGHIRWLDLGSGGGFPGLVVAALMAERGTGEVHLLESNGRKCAFLKSVIRLTAIPGKVHEGRIEDLIAGFTGNIDVVSARALAPLPQLLDWSKDLLRTGALGIFPKGQDVEAELTSASKSWRMEMDMVPSRTDANGRILIVRRLNQRFDP
jgi:16S rRNA (guanine527-N7)-methyltransferase